MTTPDPTDRPTDWLAVVTAAGRAGRFRPFSAVVPKEMLPLGGTPAVHHVITECLDAGARQVVVVTRPDDAVVPAYVERLRADGLPVEAIAEDLSHGYGNAAPLLTLQDRLRDEPLFAVAFGDDVLLGDGYGGTDLAMMQRLARGGAAAVIAAQRISREDVGSFGVVDVATPGSDQVTAIRQRPRPATVTEPLAVVSRLFCTPAVLPLLVPRTGTRGEVDLGLAVGELARRADVRVHRLHAEWVTVGEPRRYVHALLRHQHRQDQQQAPTSSVPGPSVPGRQDFA